MTNEEAITELKILKEDYWDDDGYGHETKQYDDTMLALEMAIKALEQEPCDVCISRQAVINAIANTCFWLSSDNWEELMECIDSLPPVTPQPKIGRWIADVDRWGDIVTTVNGYRCDKCNAFNTDKDNYCPNCGAKMQEVEE